MKRTHRIAAGIAATVGIGWAVAAAFAHPGPMGEGMGMRGMGMHGMAMHGGRGPMSGPMQQGDAAFQADMGLVHDMLQGHESIRRSVTQLPDGIRTVTESDDPEVARALIAHVASMQQRKKDGKEFNLFSPTVPVLFENRAKITTTVETTPKGVTVTQTAAEPKLVAALQAHAGEVSELARDGMAAMRRGMQARMARGSARH